MGVPNLRTCERLVHSESILLEGLLRDINRMAPERFAIQIPDATLADLALRLEATRWPDELVSAGWEFGSNLAYMRSLAEYWRHGYDWRREESALNQLPQYCIALDGINIHFVHVRGK